MDGGSHGAGLSSRVVPALLAFRLPAGIWAVISGMCVWWLEAEVCARGGQHPVILHRERISPCRHIPKGAGPQPQRCCARS